MFDGNVYVHLPSASFTESCDTCCSSSKEEIEVASTAQAYEGERVHQTKISTKTDKHGSSPVVSSSRFEQKTPVTECLRLCSVFYGEIYVKNW